MFVTSGGMSVNRSNIWAEMKRLCAKAGIPEQRYIPIISGICLPIPIMGLIRTWSIWRIYWGIQVLRLPGFILFQPGKSSRRSCRKWK